MLNHETVFSGSWSSLLKNNSRGLPEAWQAKVPLAIKQGAYLVKVADCLEEFRQVIELRTEVFVREFAGKASGSADAGLDFEPIDLQSDFLIIKCQKTNDVLASYRLISSEFSQEFYSSSEFTIEEFLKTTDRKLELSRACVRADKRSSGIFVHLLWRGIAEYSARTEARYLFGCSSIQTLDLRQLIAVYRYLQSEKALDPSFGVAPRDAYKIIDINGLLTFSRGKVAESDSSQLLPPILLGYLRAGARVYGAPAFDQDFNCLDLFTILDFQQLSGAHARKYVLSS